MSTPPKNLRVTSASDSSISLAWDTNDSYTHTWIIRETNGDGGVNQTGSTPGTMGGAWTDNAVSANNKYVYQVGVEYSPGNYGYSNKVTQYTSPAAPTNAAVARVSDTQHTVTWTRPANAEHVHERQRVQRWDNVTNAWYDRAVLTGGSASSYSDTTTQADRRYQYRIRGENAAGNSAYSTSGYIYTTPAAPTNAVAIRQDLNVKITWDNLSTIAAAVEVERRTKDGTWGAWANIATLSGIAVEYIDVAPGAGEHQYRVRTERDTLVSSYSTTNEVQTLIPPGAPTNLFPNGIPLDAAEEQIFSWIHNTIDGTGQTTYDLRYREQGESVWIDTGDVVSSNQSRIITAATLDNGKQWEWQVRTKGQHADYGPWSATAIFTASVKPVTVITYPASDGDTHGNPELTVEWLYSDEEATAQSSGQVNLYDDSGKLLHTRQDNGVNEYTIPYDLTDGESYKVEVRTRDGDGLWGDYTTRTFFVSYAPPVTPSLDVNFDKTTASVIIQIYNDEPGEGVPDAVYNRVYRRIADESPILVADKVSLNTTITDYIPALTDTNIYFVVTVSDIESLSVSKEEQVSIDVKSDYWLNSGAAFSDGIKLTLKSQLQDGFGRDVVNHKFAGRKYAVSFQDETGKNEIISLSALLKVEDEAQLKKVTEDNNGPVYYRDHFGRRFMAAVQNQSLRKDLNGYYLFSCSLTRVEGEQ